MPPKKVARKGSAKKKTKAPEFETGDEDCMKFGLRAKDVVRTPLGLSAQVLGVKWEDVHKTSGRLWVEYSNGLRAPLEPRTNIIPLGYKRSSEAEAIWRDIALVRDRVRVLEEQRAAAEKARLAMDALALEGAGKQKKKGAATRPATAK